MIRKLVLLCAAIAAFASALLPTAEAVVNGSTVADANLADHDWIAALVSPDGTHRCTAAFIAPTQLLTAAHCLDDGHRLEVLVGIGADGSPSHRYDILNVAMHPGYDVQREVWQDYIAVHDIGIIDIVGRHDTWIGLDFDPASISEGTSAMAFGYGLPTPGRLTVLQEPIAEGIGCAAGPNPRTHLFCLDNGFVDRGGVGINDTVCAGDSGGPVIVGRSVVGVHSLRMPSNDGCPGTATRSGHTAIAPSRDFLEFHLARAASRADDPAPVDPEPVTPADLADHGPQITITDLAVMDDGGSGCTLVAEYLADQGFAADRISDVAISSTGSGDLHSVVAWHHSGGIWQGTITRGLTECSDAWNLHATLVVVTVDGVEHTTTSSTGELECDPALGALDPGLTTDLIDPVASGPAGKRAAADGQMVGESDSPHTC